ncbi:hypothetical protein AOQ84DRAFT_213164 [Glonium stellatum]|uniref:Uncharacterized protein n=1 Tax=Glonium stellatum TaxID=574774 RepID=A0A8E2ENF3_9PEZI|nr:hypothetical protein AOQ84DRAFT_213164 [Glonium stellatum]
MPISSEINLPGGLRVQSGQILIAFTINIVITRIAYFALFPRDVSCLPNWLAWSEFAWSERKENMLNCSPHTFITWANQLPHSPTSAWFILLILYPMLGTLGFMFGTGQPSHVTLDPPQVRPFVSFQTSSSPVTSEVGTLQDDDNESTCDSSDKELKIPRDILDQLELSETGPFSAPVETTPALGISLLGSE